MNNNTQKMCYAKLLKLETRLLRSLKTGSFFFLKPDKQSQLARRLQAFATQLKRAIKPAFATAFLALGLSTINAQTFTAQTGTANPLDGLTFSSPVLAFVDIDNDGDMDFFAGLANGTIVFYRNTGTNSAASFTAQTGANNPFNGVDVGLHASPTFVDIDNDGDKDLFIGEYSGVIFYYRNTGTAASATFTASTGSNNPFNGVDVGRLASPSFVDIDNDGDFDTFIGEIYGQFLYYRNTGTAASPTFTATTGTNNPFNSVDIGYKSAPVFVDIDNDGDFDMFTGEMYGSVLYYRNTGTNTNAVFTAQTASNNPFNGIDFGGDVKISFVDIDNDGDKDAFIGDLLSGTVSFYKNNTVVAAVSTVEETAFKIYPNPTQSMLNIEIADNEAAAVDITVWNNIGQVVFEEKNNTNNQINISVENWPNAVYLIRIGSRSLTFVKN